MIIDAHCHAGTGDGLTGPWDTRAPLDEYLKRANSVGITRTVLFAAFNDDCTRGTREVARIVASHPDRFLGFAFLNPTRQRGSISEHVRWAKRRGFVGVKVHRHEAPITREVCDAARALGMPVLYDVAGEVWTCELLASEYPDVDFIIPHLGSFADDWRAQLAMIDHLCRHENIYADTSGVRRFDLLQQAVRRAGPHKLLFGSDGPWLHPAVELAKVWALELPNDQQRLVLAGNLLRILGKGRRRQQQRMETTS